MRLGVVVGEAAGTFEPDEFVHRIRERVRTDYRRMPYPITKDLFVVTFDDGYRDVYRYAYPVLKQMGVPAITYLPTAFIDTDKRFNHDRLFHLLRKVQDRRFRPDFDTMPRRNFLGCPWGKGQGRRKLGLTRWPVKEALVGASQNHQRPDGERLGLGLNTVCEAACLRRRVRGLWLPHRVVPGLARARTQEETPK